MITKSKVSKQISFLLPFVMENGFLEHCVVDSVALPVRKVQCISAGPQRAAWYLPSGAAGQAPPKWGSLTTHTPAIALPVT